MGVYSYAQLEYLWISNGGNSSVAPIMAAIAEAESSGNSESTNPTDNGGTQTSWGLWQISDGTHNQPVANILDPNVNAQQAVAKYNSGGFRPWGTYSSGAYRRFLQSGVPPVSAGVPAGGSGPSTGGPTQAGLFTLSPDCLIGLPLGVTDVCILNKTEARALIGGGVALISLWTGTIGVLVIMGTLFLRSPAAAALTMIPGAGGTVARIGRSAAVGRPVTGVVRETVRSTRTRKR